MKNQKISYFWTNPTIFTHFYLKTNILTKLWPKTISKNWKMLTWKPKNQILT